MGSVGWEVRISPMVDGFAAHQRLKKDVIQNRVVLANYTAV